MIAPTFAGPTVQHRMTERRAAARPTGVGMTRARWLVVICAIAILASSCLDIRTETEIARGSLIGKSVADFELTSATGAPFHLTETQGKVVVIIFWSARCPYTERYDPRINQLYQDYRDREVAIIGIDAHDEESRAEIQTAIAERDIQFPLYLDPDGRVARALIAETTPHAFIIDRQGRLVYEGAIDDEGWMQSGNIKTQYVREALDELLAGQKVTIQQSPPFGCAINITEE